MPEGHNRLTLELVHTNYISEDDSQIFDYDKLFEIKKAINNKIPNVGFEWDEILVLFKENITLSGERLDALKIFTMLNTVEDVQHVNHKKLYYR